jgi:hypothetical protein
MTVEASNPAAGDSEPSATTSGPHPSTLTKAEQTSLRGELLRFARRRLLLKNTARARNDPFMDFWTGADFDSIIDSFFLFQSKDAVDSLLAGWRYLSEDVEAFLDLAIGLHKQFRLNEMKQGC